METKECPYATHALHLKCHKCDRTDVVLCKDAKDWECPSCAIHDQHMIKEINMWRSRFVEEMLENGLLFVSEECQNRLKAYFMSIPSANMEDPFRDWNRCISAIIQHLEDRK